jgi:hypothetical protein
VACFTYGGWEPDTPALVYVFTRAWAGWDVPTSEDDQQKAAEYQRLAAECLRLSHASNDPTNKALLFKMTQTWIRLAEQLKARGKKPKE